MKWKNLRNSIFFRQDFTRAFGMRKELGTLYQTNHLNEEQISQLAELDRKVLTFAVDLKTVYGLNIRQLLQNLVQWGTPLTQQKGLLQITTTILALFDLAQIRPAAAETKNLEDNA